ncbi:MAG: ribonuclease Y [Armatimonadetes bacterium]|nr:ribonuclease Y [Armatimonadota bacterium]MCX7967253.1 ribonuclease Y [Armatimonadota bacterium]MDW8142419.1 ribonuclease Y [Armatimonadota bacterium]
MEIWVSLLIGLVIGIIVAAGVIFWAWKALLLPQQQRLDTLRQRLEEERNKADRMQRDAEAKLREAEAKLRDANLLVREELQRERERLEQEYRERREELLRWERRLSQREEQIDRRMNQIEQREQSVRQEEARIQNLKQEAEEMRQKAQAELERIAELTPEQARQIVLARVEEELQSEIARRIYEAEERIKQEAEERAKKIIATAMQRCAVEVASEMTVTTVSLPSEEMKGRIIGREGRNIRTFELLTGVDLIVDDTPEAVVISCFDPIRRETARLALEMLIADGRIHPARIEEVVEKARQEMEQRILKAGQDAARAAGVDNLPEGLLKLLGRLKFRTSYGQNVLDHSVEVAHLAGMMAEELKVSSKIARRAGLLHDIGKALDHHMEGSHIEIGMDVLRRYGEPEEVIHAVVAHHGDIQPQSVEAVLVLIADALSASRPGARRESFEAYIRRLEQLENIAKSFTGVDKAYVIQAGREVRVIVKPDQIDDVMAAKLARDIAARIQQETQFPGQIKVTVIREVRAVEYAR